MTHTDGLRDAACGRAHGTEDPETGIPRYR